MEKIYCLKCKTKTNTKDIRQVQTKNNRNMLTGTCVVCGIKKNKFISKTKGSGWTDLPFEMHLPGYNFVGPGTNLKKRLNVDDTPITKPINKIDEIAMNHDICYRDNLSTKERNNICDKKMLKDLKNTKTVGLKEWLDKSIVKNLIGAKQTLGLGWLTSDLANELHKPIVKKFHKRKVIVNGIDKIWAADLIDMQKFSKQNKHYKYLLTVIDVFSKYVWIVPLKTKTGIEVANAFKTVFKHRIPKKLWTDKGTEFYNKITKELFKTNDIELYSTQNEEKSSVIERFNRTLKDKIFKYFTAYNTTKYYDVLDQIVNEYNNTFHNTIKMKPVEASKKENESVIFETVFKDKLYDKKPKFKIGDRVRITKYKKHFEKGYTTNFTREIFFVDKVLQTNPITYKIKDQKGEEIVGSFYEQELQKTKF